MRVVKRDGQFENVAFDKILRKNFSEEAVRRMAREVIAE